MDATKQDILLVEDDRAVSRYTTLVLERKGYRVTPAYSAKHGISLLKSRAFPLVVSDLYLGDDTGLSLIPHTKSGTHPSFIIFLTGQGSIGTTVQAIHNGAFAYLSKPPDLIDLERELVPVVRRAFAQIATLEKGVAGGAHSTKVENRAIIGKTPAMIEVYHAIAKASLSPGNVILLGESGSGKELVARAIHDNSCWALKPFVTINCSALSDTLLESELFGHVKGAFTGALINKRGLFEEANGGTLFLDEIGDIPPPLQVKLLHAIQEGEIRPVGASENCQVDVRIIAATHRDLSRLVAERSFREDLYYRLKVFLVHVPPLRDRMEDLPDLVSYFLGRTGKKLGREVDTVSEEAMRLLFRYHWPGNIRELENAIDRAAAMSNTNVLFPEDFPIEVASLKAADEAAPAPALSDRVNQSLGQVEHDHILKTLERVGFNKSKAAEILGIDRGTLYRKALRYSIPLEQSPEKP